MITNHKNNFAKLILILGSIIAIGPLSLDMYLPAFLAISQDLLASQKQVQLSVASYFIGLAIGQIIYGPIIDRFGRRLPLLIGLCIFALTSFACAFVSSIEQLIILRFFQAFACCAAMVVPRAVVRDVFAPEKCAQVFSYLMLVMGVAPIIAPVIGNFLLNNFGWRAVFVFLGCFGLLCFILAFVSLKAVKGANVDDRISQALKKYFGILQDKTFLVSSLTGSFLMASLFSYITASAFLYTDFFAISTKTYSLIFAGNALGWVLISQINVFLLKKFNMKKIVEKAVFIPFIFGSCLVFCGFMGGSFWQITILFFAFLSTIGMIIPNITALALSNQSKHAGSASALFGTIQFVVASIASFLVGKVAVIIPAALISGACGVICFLIFTLFLKQKINQN